MQSTTKQIPIISLKSTSVLKEIFSACSTYGAFVVTDHDIPSQLCNEVLKKGHDFFDLPQAEKEKYHLSQYGASWRGFMPFGGERSLNGEKIDFKEGMYMGEEHTPSHPNIGLPTFGRNVFPKEISGMRELYLEYHKQMTNLGNEMMRLLSKSLGLKENSIAENITENNPIILPRMFSYFPQESDNVKKTVNWGIGRHSDYGLWTMILTDSAGLEFQDNTTDEWISVPFVNNGIIMNVGDVLDRLTKGIFVSSYHRARNLSSTKHRLSLPFFYDPSWTAKMKTLPVEDQKIDAKVLKRWENTKIRCKFDGTVAYSEFLAKKVAKVFPDLVPEPLWKNLSSTSEPSTRHAIVVNIPEINLFKNVIQETKDFYSKHKEIDDSHGFPHVSSVLNHATNAIRCHIPPLSEIEELEVKTAALLHDVDDHKYFKNNKSLENATEIMNKAQISKQSQANIKEMINLVSCSKNGNSVPQKLLENGEFFRLIPRWSDRLEAVGAIGVIRCYQYSKENNRPLFSENSPRPQNIEEVWNHAKPERFTKYQTSGGNSEDMISHYFDKLLHVVRPPVEIVQNSYLEKTAEIASKEIVELLLRFGKTGQVDEDYISQLENELKAR